MNALVYVEPEDDVRSVRSRLERIEGSSVGIAVPLGRPAFASPVALRLLKREAEAQSLRLCVVTLDPDLRDLARAEGIRVYRSPAAYERGTRLSGAEGPPQSASAAFLPSPVASALAIALFLALLVVGALVVLPEMTVTVSPRTMTVSQTVQVLADPGQQSVDVERRRIPARPVMLSVDAVDRLAPGEGGAASDGRASGLVTFTNRTPEAVEVPKGSVVSTASGIRFETQQAVAMPGGIGRTASAHVVAEVAGDQGNVRRLQITSVQGSLDARVYVQNEDSMAGGGIPGSRIVTAVDRDRLLKRVTEKARGAAEAELKASLATGDLLVGQSVRFMPLEASFDAEVGEEVTSLGLYLRAQASGLVVSAEHLDRVGRQAWEPAAKAGFEVVPGSLRAAAPEAAGVEGRATVVTIRLEALTRAKIDLQIVEQVSRWRSGPEVKQLLSKAFDLARPPEVQFAPNWARWAYRVHAAVESDVSRASR